MKKIFMALIAAILAIGIAGITVPSNAASAERKVICHYHQNEQNGHNEIIDNIVIIAEFPVPRAKDIKWTTVVGYRACYHEGNRHNHRWYKTKTLLVVVKLAKKGDKFTCRAFDKLKIGFMAWDWEGNVNITGGDVDCDPGDHSIVVQGRYHDLPILHYGGYSGEKHAPHYTLTMQAAIHLPGPGGIHLPFPDDPPFGPSNVLFTDNVRG